MQKLIISTEKEIRNAAYYISRERIVSNQVFERHVRDTVAHLINCKFTILMIDYHYINLYFFKFFFI